MELQIDGKHRCLRYRHEYLVCVDHGLFRVGSLGLFTDAVHRYNVTATGDVPSTRCQFCSAVSAAPDDSSFQIHMYGGGHLNNNITYQDLYILSIPSFRWIKKVNAGDQAGAKGAQTATANGYYAMQCAMYKDRQMLILGGLFKDPVTDWNNKVCNASYPVVKVLDVTNLQWKSQFDPSLDPYKVPHTVFDVIGGE